MDDEVADFQVAEVGNERPVGRSAPLEGLAFLFEQVGFGEHEKARGRQMESARETPDRDEHRGVLEIVGLRDGAGPDVVVREEFDRPLRASR
jgi:hypothetical protein